MSGERGESIVALIDMDCFYVQVEQRCQPDLWGKPVAVVQYHQSHRGGIIAVGYEARASGVKRGMKGDEAKRLCPDLTLSLVPVSRGKANLTRYREASAEVFRVLSEFVSDGVVVERASIDEAYLDLSGYVDRVIRNQVFDDECSWEKDLFEDTHVFLDTDETGEETRMGTLQRWLSDNSSNGNECRKLAVAAALVAKIRQRIKERTQFHCSAGIAVNKTLAKISCGINKPRQQTIMPMDSLSALWSRTPITKIRNLGGKLGHQVCSMFDINTMEQLAAIPERALVTAFGERTGQWLVAISRGEDNELVKEKDLLKSIGCGKNFMGKESLVTVERVEVWLRSLIEELLERLIPDREINHRFAKTLTVGLRVRRDERDLTGVPSTRAVSLTAYETEPIVSAALKALTEFNQGKDGAWFPGIINLSLSAGRFEDCTVLDGVKSIREFFKPTAGDESTPLPSRNYTAGVDLSERPASTIEEDVPSTSYDCDSRDNGATGWDADDCDMQSDAVVALARETESYLLKKWVSNPGSCKPMSPAVRRYLRNKSGLLRASGDGMNARPVTKSLRDFNFTEMSTRVDATKTTENEGINDGVLADFPFEHPPRAELEPLSQTDLAPPTLDTVDQEVFASLPEDVKLELRSFYRRHTQGSTPDSSTQSAGRSTNGIARFFVNS